jgi:hypothetical protein
MMLVISLILALIPLLGIAGIVLNGSLFTVDGLFMSLIFLAMSGILGLNAAYEMRKRATASRNPGSGATGTTRRTTAAGLVERGKVESVSFFESNVGQPNKSIVTLSNGSKSSQMLVFEGDMRNALPVGRRVEITFRKDGGHNVLVDVVYS